MQFDEKELDMIITKRIDKIVFQHRDKNVFFVDVEDLMKKRIENDPNLRKQLLAQALQSPN